MTNNQTGCINRDENSVNNMKLLTESWIETRTRPEIYRRKHPQERASMSQTEAKRHSQRKNRSTATGLIATSSFIAQPSNPAEMQSEVQSVKKTGKTASKTTIKNVVVRSRLQDKKIKTLSKSDTTKIKQSLANESIK